MSRVRSPSPAPITSTTCRPPERADIRRNGRLCPELCPYRIELARGLQQIVRAHDVVPLERRARLVPRHRHRDALWGCRRGRGCARPCGGNRAGYAPGSRPPDTRRSTVCENYPPPQAACSCGRAACRPSGKRQRDDVASLLSSIVGYPRAISPSPYSSRIGVAPGPTVLIHAEKGREPRPEAKSCRMSFWVFYWSLGRAAATVTLRSGSL